MSWARPTLQELRDRIAADFQTQIQNSNSLLRRSILRVMSVVYAGAIHLTYGFLSYVARQIMVETAGTDELDTHASEWGVVRLGATQATGTVMVTGTSGSVAPAGAELYRASDDWRFTLDDDITCDIAGNTGTFMGSGDVTAVAAGADANDEGGIALVFTAPIPGVNATATVGTGGLAGGTDIETDDALRARVLYRKRYPPHGGATHDFVAWALENAGVTRAWCFPLYAGVEGAVALAFVKDAEVWANRLPDAAQRAAMEAYIVSHADPVTGETVGLPVTMEPGFQVLTLVWLDVDLEIGLTPDTDDIRVAIDAELDDLFLRKGGAGQTVLLSDIREAVAAGGNAATGAGEAFMFRVDLPTDDVTAAYTQVHRTGTIDWGSY